MHNEHGEALIYVKDNIIVAELIGAFNEEGAKKYTQDIKNIVNESQNKNIFILVNDLKVEGGTPEAYQELEKHNHWLTTHNLIAKAIVIKSAATVELLEKLSPSQKQQNCKIFDNESDAFTWLRSFQR
ncbi:hypothetical protein A9Q74_07860 [Colwellia sp. 39_35_sub15_T18]|nr:hypothetical protein A9Q74_07860 [Colwellia sp. 39_35_sub15_T18]